MDTGDQQLTYFLGWFLSPVAIPLVIGAIFLMAATVVVRPLKWAWLTLLLYASTLGSDASNLWFDNTLIGPLEQMRNFNRPFCTAMLFLLLVPTLLSVRGWRTRVVLGATVAFFCLELVLSVRTLFGGIMSRGVFGTVIFALTFVTLGFGVSRWFQRSVDAYAAVRCIAVAGMIMIPVTLLQLAANRHAIVLNGRLFGITNNPNTLGYISGFTIPAMCVLLLRRQESRLFRAALIFAMGISIVFVAWTGSRAGVLVTAIGLLLVCRRHVSKALLIVMLTVPLVLLAAQFFVDVDWARLVSSDDTRSKAWASMLRAFVSSPIFGHVNEMLGIEESLYLGVAANMGLVGLVPLLFFICLTGARVLRLGRVRPLLGEDALLADFVQATTISVAVGSLFDAHLLGTFVFSAFCMYLNFGLLAYVGDAAAANAAAAEANGYYAYGDDQAYDLEQVYGGRTGHAAY